MFCLRVSESRYKRFVSEDMDMSEMWSRTWQGYQCRKKYTDRGIKTNSIKKYIGQGLPKLTPVSATIQSISETIAAQNNSVKDILAEIDEIAGVSTKLEEHFDMEQAQCE